MKDGMAVKARNAPQDEFAARLRQQEMVAGFGTFALRATELAPVLTEACRVASLGLQTRFAKVLRFRPESDDLLIVAGVGWRPGVVGHMTLGAGLGSPAGYALHTGEPVLSNNLGKEDRFQTPELLVEHGVHSAINVAIDAADASLPFGVLEVDGTARGEFVAADTAFLQSLSSVLAAAQVRHATEQAKDALLREKDLLMLEVHHRVKNSLQLVRALLQLQARSASDETRAQLEAAAGRIMTISAVHRHLYEGNSTAQTDAAAYLRALVGDIQAMVDTPENHREITVQGDPLRLSADQTTPLGLVTSELVANALKHGAGRVLVSLRGVPGGLQVRVEDEGPGFPPDFAPRLSGSLGMRLVTALAKGDPAQALVIDPSAGHGCVVATLKL
jgi:two-component sensor histidine kinase